MVKYLKDKMDKLKKINKENIDIVENTPKKKSAISILETRIMANKLKKKKKDE